MNRIHARKMHRFIAYLAAFGLLLTTLTGVLLNHTHHLGLDKKSVQSEWLLNLYNLQKPEVLAAVKVEQNWLMQLNQKLLWNQYTLPVSGDLKKVIHIDDFVYLLSSAELHVLTFEGNWVETISLPSQLIQNPARFVQFESGMVGLQTDKKQWQINQEFSALEQRQEAIMLLLKPLDFKPPPESVKVAALTNFDSGLSWEKVILEMHNGYIIGSLGPYVLDLFALVFALMIISGIRLTRLR